MARPFLGYIPKSSTSKYLGAPEGVKCIQLKMWDLYSTGRWKQLAIFNCFIKQSSCKYLVILTSAAYLQPEKLRKALSKMAEDVIYAGPLIQKDSIAPFVSGAQIVVNRKFAEICLSNPTLLPGEKLNDLGLAIAADKMGFKPIELPTINLSSIEEVHKISERTIKENYHFRLKSFKLGKRNDVELFLKLEEKIQNYG
jgi:hypothetical protein